MAPVRDVYRGLKAELTNPLMLSPIYWDGPFSKPYQQFCDAVILYVGEEGDPSAWRW